MKNSYILRRNNQESTSLHIEDLQEIGLKQTDLIWVECQSVGWRSPLEISELKNLVNLNSNEDKKITPGELAESRTQLVEKAAVKNTQKKFMQSEVPVRKEPLKKQQQVNPLADSGVTNLNQYNELDHTLSAGFVKKKAEIQANYNRPPGEIKEMYVKRPEEKEQRKKGVVAIRVSKQLKKIALYTSLVLTGALMMYLIQQQASKKAMVVQQTDSLSQNGSPASATIPVPPIDDNTATTTNFEEPTLSIDNSTVTPKETKKQVAVIKNISLNNTDEKTELLDDKKTEKNTNPVNEIKAVKPVTVENISSKLALKASDYNVGAFGGIRNLKMTLQNDSRYILDKVTVEIQYLNPEGKILNTENIYFQYVQPGDAASLKVAKSKRGVKVDYKITNIESKELVSNQKGSPDPDNYSKN